MTLPFCEKVVNEGKINRENFIKPNFVGYLNPNGVPIYFEDNLGYTGHGEAPSIQEKFRAYYTLKIRDSEYISQLERHYMSYEYMKAQRERYISYLKKLVEEFKREVEYFRKRGICSSFTLEQMEMDIYKFLINCYSADTFFEGVGNVQTCMSELEFWNKEHKIKHPKMDFYKDRYSVKMDYDIYKDHILAKVFKDVMIQNLGYHSVERTPKTITTSASNIYEIFYNYLLNDFTIYQMPKMIFDSSKNKYIQYNHNEFLVSDSELRLKDEIQSIKRLVPIKERSKYYR